MIIKHIKVYTRPGKAEAFIASQAIWNREMARSPACLSRHCARSSGDPSIFFIWILWRSRAEYDHWMATEHDAIAELARASDWYERLEVSLLDPLTTAGGDLAPFPDPPTVTDAAGIQGLSEGYKLSAALRLAVASGLFSQLERGGEGTAQLAAATHLDPSLCGRLLAVLRAAGLVVAEGERWRNSWVAQRYLVQDAPAYQGHMVLHNTRPALVRRWFSLLTPFDTEQPEAERHATFVRAMGDTARAGQAKLLADNLDLSGCHSLLDVGGGAGEYAVALCRANPGLHATVVDLPATQPLFDEVVAAAELADRLRFFAADYRAGGLPGPHDRVLYSNVLRGLTDAEIAAQLHLAAAVLQPGGRLIVHDLFPEPEAGPSGLGAALFGLHLPAAANLERARLEAILGENGFHVTRSVRLPDPVVMNGIIEAQRGGEV